jgi:hypothetical protein
MNGLKVSSALSNMPRIPAASTSEIRAFRLFKKENITSYEPQRGEKQSAAHHEARPATSTIVM